MSDTGTKSNRKLLLIAAVVVIAAAAVIFYIIKGGSSVSKEEVIERTRQELALLQPLFDIKVEKIDASPSDCEITLHNVTFAIPDLPELSFAIDTVVQSGVDKPSYAGDPGEITTIARQSYQGIKAIMHGQTVATFEEYLEEDISLNYRSMLQVLKDNQSAGREALMIKLLPTMADSRVGRAVGKNLNLNFMFVTGSIESMETRDITLGSYGPSELKNFQVSAMGQKVFSLDKMGLAGMKMPQVFRDMLADPEGYMAKNPDFMSKMDGDPFSLLSPLEINNFYLDNLMVNAGSPLTLKSLLGDLSINDGLFTLKSSVSDLLLTRQFMAMSEAMAPLADVAKDDLHLDGNFNILVGGPGDPVDVNMDAGLKEKSLGGFAVDVAMDMPREALQRGGRDRDQQRIKSMEISADNRGIVDLLVACYAALEYQDYEDVYDELLDDLYQSLDEAQNKLQREGTQAIINLVEEGGNLNISFKPEQPVSMQELDALSDDELARLGFKVTYTPLQ